MPLYTLHGLRFVPSTSGRLRFKSRIHFSACSRCWLSRWTIILSDLAARAICAEICGESGGEGDTHNPKSPTVGHYRPMARAPLLNFPSSLSRCAGHGSAAQAIRAQLRLPGFVTTFLGMREGFLRCLCPSSWCRVAYLTLRQPGHTGSRKPLSPGGRPLNMPLASTFVRPIFPRACSVRSSSLIVGCLGLRAGGRQ